LYEFQLGRSATQTARNLDEVFGEEMVNGCTVQLWFKNFYSGDLSLENKGGWGHLPVIDSDQLRALMETIPCQTVQEMGCDLDLYPAAVSYHLSQSEE
jgi:hypothetical protein